MAKKREQKGQFNIRLPNAVIRHLGDRYLDTGSDRALQALAAFVAFECLGEPARNRMIQLATRVEQGVIDWDEFVAVARKTQEELLNDRSLQRTLRKVIEHFESPPAKRRPA